MNSKYVAVKNKLKPWLKKRCWCASVCRSPGSRLMLIIACGRAARAPATMFTSACERLGSNCAPLFGEV